MALLRKLKKVINDPWILIVVLLSGKLGRLLDDELYLKIKYRAIMGKKLNLNAPRAYNEKLQWLKLYDRNPKYTQLVDKHEAKRLVADRIGQEYIIPTLGVWDRPEDIDFDSLPEQFVLKCTHDSGGLVICKDKSILDQKAAIKKLRKALKRNYYYIHREWPYKDVKPRIIAEKYISDAQGDLKDYKFMCFGGNVKCSFVCSNRLEAKGLHVTFFDLDWNVMPFDRHYPRVKEGVPKPQQYEKMLELAKILSEGMPFVRVDFYEVDGKVYFGEMTLYPGAGFEEFTPACWDEVMGDWIELPEKRSN